MGKKTVLLVEDDPVVRETIKEVLERRFLVLEASNHQEALRHLERPVHIALVDYVIPGSNGFDILNDIRKVSPRIPAILLTGYSTEDLAIKAIRAGVTDYIKKPLSLKYLVNRVSEILDGNGSGESSEPECVKKRMIS